MTSFIVIAVVLTLLSIAWLLRPLLMSAETDLAERQRQNIQFARERLAELDEQHQSGRIDTESFTALRAEIEASLALDLDDEDSPQIDPAQAVADERSRTLVLALVGSLIPFAALIVYLVTGTPAAITTIAPQAITADGNAASPQNIDQMVSSLEQRLATRPDDVEGWTILARTYQQLGRYPQAVRAWQHLLTVHPENSPAAADTFAALADASALQAGGQLAGQPTSYLQRALAINPAQPQALWLSGLSAAQAGDANEALRYWDELMPLLADIPAQQQELQEIITQTRASLGATAAAGNPPQDVATNNGSSDQSIVAPAAQSTGGLQVQVTLDPALAADLASDTTVFVFARAIQGPPAPLAVKRLQVADLPTTVSLSDADAMLPQLSLSLFPDVQVSARVSRSGNPIAQPGDLQSAAVATANQNPELIQLIIDSTVP